MKVKYTGPARDFSGYGECTRHEIGALVAAGVEVTAEIPSYVNEISDYGKLGRLAVELEDKPLDYNIKVIHLTQDQFPHYREAGKYNIARLLWETDRIPEAFINGIKDADEIWTASEHTVEAIKNSGITTPTFVIPEAIDIAMETTEPYQTAADGFRFYSIFEWSERKNPKALLEAYWREFTEKDQVSLVIKTYSEGFQAQHKNIIDQEIEELKQRLNLSYYAPVYLYRELMDRTQIYRFHQTFDCFVSAHRGEGWGIPQMEAMLVGNPIISTNAGGIHEYLTNKENALLVSNALVNVRGDRKWYTSDQNWAEVLIDDLRENMRWAYSHPRLLAKLARKGQEYVMQNFSLEAVGKKMRERLEQI